MKYRWNEKELQEKLEEAKKENDELNTLNYEGMLDLLHGKMNYEWLDFVPEVDHESFMVRKNRFFENINYLGENVTQFAASIFSIEKCEDYLFNEFQTEQLKLTNKELIELGYETLESLNNNKVLQIYQEITNPYNHYLNIMSFGEFMEGATKEIHGLTIPDKKRHKSYITIHRNNDADDVRTIVHEALHAYFFKKYRNSAYVTRYFDEIEGRFGNRLTANYMLKHDMEHYGNELRISELYSLLNESYAVYLNNCLYKTAARYYYRLKAATNELRKNTKFKDSTIREEDLKYICSYNCFESVTEIIDYLICLEAEELTDNPAIQLRFIEEIRKHDGNFDFYNKELPKKLDFYKDHVKALKRYKKECDQFIREK